MTHTRKKLLLREDEADVIKFALYKLVEALRTAKKEYRAMQIFALSAADKGKYEASEKNTQEVIVEIERILKLVQDAEVTETVVEL